MNGIINSELDTADLTGPSLHAALHENDYILGILQRNMFNQFKFDANDARWANVTPAQYRAVMSHRLTQLDNQFWQLLIDFEKNINKAFAFPEQQEPEQK